MNYTEAFIRQVMLNSKGAEARQLFKESYQALFRYFISNTNSKESAEDLSQATLVKIAQHITSFEFRSSYRTWMYRIAHNQLVNHYKHEAIVTRSISSAEDGFIDAYGSAGDFAGAHDLLQGYLQAIAKMTDDQRQAFLLFELNDLSYQEIADIVGTTTGTVKSRISRARDVLVPFVENSEELLNTVGCLNDKKKKSA